MSIYQLKHEDKPKDPNDRTRNVIFRLSEKEYALLKQKAALYTGGNSSHWIRAALKNYKPRRSDLIEVD